MIASRPSSLSPLRASHLSPLNKSPNSNFFGGTFQSNQNSEDQLPKMMRTKENEHKMLRVMASHKRVNESADNPYVVAKAGAIKHY